MPTRSGCFALSSERHVYRFWRLRDISSRRAKLQGSGMSLRSLLTAPRKAWLGEVAWHYSRRSPSSRGDFAGGARNVERRMNVLRTTRLFWTETAGYPASMPRYDVHRPVLGGGERRQQRRRGVITDRNVDCIYVCFQSSSHPHVRRWYLIIPTM